MHLQGNGLRKIEGLDECKQLTNLYIYLNYLFINIDFYKRTALKKLKILMHLRN